MLSFASAHVKFTCEEETVTVVKFLGALGPSRSDEIVELVVFGGLVVVGGDGGFFAGGTTGFTVGLTEGAGTGATGTGARGVGGATIGEGTVSATRTGGGSSGSVYAVPK